MSLISPIICRSALASKYFNESHFKHLSPKYPIFPLGECKLRYTPVPDGLTREEWYKQRIMLQEDTLKQQIMEELEVEEQDFEKYKSASIDLSKKFEAEELKDRYLEAEEFYKSRGIENVKVYKDSNFFMENGKNVGGSAFLTKILINASVLQSKKYPEIIKKFILLHELSHIQHEDLINAMALGFLINHRKNNYNNVTSIGQPFANNSMKEFTLQSPLSLNPLQNSDDMQAERIKKAEYLYHLLDIYTERRADFEGLTALKENIDYTTDFQRLNCNSYSFFRSVGYSYCSPVNFLKDFIQGQQHDKKMQNKKDLLQNQKIV